MTITALVQELRDAGLKRQARVLNCMGYRREESPRRDKMQPLVDDKRGTSGRRRVEVWSPILEWTLEDVWQRIAQAGTRHHWAYDAGMPRLSCCFCVLANPQALVLAAQLRPELAAEYARVEANIGHSFKHKLPMSEIIERAKAASIDVVPDWVA